MVCTNCGTEFDSNFCPNCGAPAPQAAPAAPEIELCPGCGAPLENGVCPLCVTGLKQEHTFVRPEPSANRFVKKLISVLKFIGYVVFGLWNLFGLLIIPQSLSVAMTLLGVSWLFFIAVRVLWKRARADISRGSSNVEQPVPTGSQEQRPDVPEETLTVAGNRYFKVTTVPGKPISRAAKKLAEEYQEKVKTRAQIAYNRAHGVPMCSKCHSTHVQALSPNATLGFVSDVSVYMLPPSSKYTEMVCLACGHRWSIKNRR